MLSIKFSVFELLMLISAKLKTRYHITISDTNLEISDFLDS